MIIETLKFSFWWFNNTLLNTSCSREARYLTRISLLLVIESLMKAVVCIPTPVVEVSRYEPGEMTISLAWTSKQCASFNYIQSEMSSDEVIGPWEFWPHYFAFYWPGCTLLWHLIESGKGKFSLLELNPWGWALEECFLFPDAHLLAPYLCFQAGIMWTAFCHHTLFNHDLLSPRAPNSNVIYPLPWTEMTESISQNIDFLLFSCPFCILSP